MTLPRDDPSSVEEIHSERETLRRMYVITADSDRSFEEKVGDLLELGRTYLDIGVGFLTEIAEGEQRIVAACGEHELLRPGASCPLSKAYCRRTIEREDTLSVEHAAIEGWEGDAAYEEFGLESYIGAKIVLEGTVFGTVCFADSEPREDPFTEEESRFVELLAEWAGYELFQQQATERIQRQRDQLREFTGVVSHDLRNPLNVVQGYLDLAEETGDPEHFERCREALEHMGQLIDDLLVLARTGDEVAETEPADLSELSTECWGYVATEGATLELETEQTVTGDWSRLQQVFENLFRNSVEHGGDDVTVEVGDIDGDAGVYVADDGEGLPEGDYEAVFDEGYSTSEQGTGYGLSIARQIVQAHGWSITATDSPEGGARFEIRWDRTTGSTSGAGGDGTT